MISTVGGIFAACSNIDSARKSARSFSSRRTETSDSLAVHFGYVGRQAIYAATSKKPFDLDYKTLHAIPELGYARNAVSVELNSPDSVRKTVFQIADIALWNMAILTRLAGEDLARDDVGAAIQKMGWIKDINSLAVDSSRIVNMTPLDDSRSAGVKIQDTRAYASFRDSFSNLSRVVQYKVSGNDMAEVSANKPQWAALFQDIVILEDEAKVWMGRLNGDASSKRRPKPMPASRFIGEVHLEKAVKGLVLEDEGDTRFTHTRILPQDPVAGLIGEKNWARLVKRGGEDDTRFTQFRALHQIPETACVEVNNRLEAATQAIQQNKPVEALKHLQVANQFFPILISSVRVIYNNLTVRNYHDIRDALKQTSGSDSEAFRKLLLENGPALQNAMASLESKHDTDGLWPLVMKEVLTVRDACDTWRAQHHILPLLYLGRTASSQMPTKSLKGADGVANAEGMRRKGHERKDMQPVDAMIRTLRLPSGRQLYMAPSPFAEAGANLTQAISTATADNAQTRFTHVQERRPRGSERHK